MGLIGLVVGLILYAGYAWVMLLNTGKDGSFGLRMDCFGLAIPIASTILALRMRVRPISKEDKVAIIFNLLIVAVAAVLFIFFTLVATLMTGFS